MITIGIPTKNRPESLSRELISILGSAPPDLIYEIIIADCGSINNDFTRKVLKIVESQFKVRVIDGGEGLVKTRKRLLNECDTANLFSIDDDVLLSRNSFDVYPFDNQYAFCCPRLIVLDYFGDQYLDFPEEKMLLPYSDAEKRVPLWYMDTSAVLLNVEKCLDAGCFDDTRNMGEFIDASIKLHKKGLLGLYEPKALVFDCRNKSDWHNPDFGNPYPFPKEFEPYYKPNPNKIKGGNINA